MSCKWITAHSGCEGTPDNSEQNIRAAVQSGADLLEVDVRRVEGQLVLTHNLPQPGETCMTLADCFRLVKALSERIGINCDLKEEGLELDVLQLAQANGLAGRIVLTGTVNPALTLPGWAMVSMNVENLLPGLYEQVWEREDKRMTAEEELKLLAKAQQYGVTSLNMNYHLFSRGLGRRMGEAGITFSLWTANDEESIRSLLDCDLENLTTRLPVLACQLRQQMERGKGV